MKSIISILLSVKNMNTKRILYEKFKKINILADNFGFFYYLDNYRIVYIF